MSKNKDEVKAATPAPSPAAAPAAVPAPVEAAPAALATTQPAAVAALEPALAGLPEMHRVKAAKIVRPTTQEFEAAVQLVAADQREKLVELIERMSSDKPGVHRSQEGFAPTLVKLYHGVGNDESRPAKLVPGNFYSSTSRDLTDKMVVAILGFSDGRTLWPPKDAESNQPVCSSHDGVNGSKYGACASCPSKALPYTKGGCTPQFNFWFIDQEATGIYELVFSKTSYKAGQALARTVSDSRRAWDRWIEFASVARTEGDKKWFVVKASPISDPKVPANNETSKELRSVFSLFNRALELGTLYPRLARQYTRQGDEGGAAPEAAPTGAGSALKADTSDGDFGGANPGL